MHFWFIPAGDERTASSRIRVYTLQRAMIRTGLSVKVGSPVDGGPLDVLVVQKKATRETVDMVHAAKARGALVVYDVDDLSVALDYWVHPFILGEMMALADVVTTDTQGHQDLIQRQFSLGNVELVPDAIDYFLSSPQPAPDLPPDPLRIMWFGSSSNIQLFRRYAGALIAIPGVKVVVATTGNLAQFSRDFPAIEFLEWTLRDFPAQLRSCQLSCLMHDGDEIDRAKSNNKMITSIAMGVPALVSITPEYARTARAAGVESSIFTGEGDLARVCGLYGNKEQRDAYLKAAQPYVWSQYSAQAVTLRFLRVIEKYLALKSGRASAAPTPAPGMKTDPRPLPAVVAPVRANPGSEVTEVLRQYGAREVLQVGCGFPEVAVAAAAVCNLYVCDISAEKLRSVPAGVTAFQYFPQLENQPFLRQHQSRWDAIYVYGEMGKTIANPIETAYMMNNLMMLSKGKILVWDTQPSIDAMRRFVRSDRFEYRLMGE